MERQEAIRKAEETGKLNGRAFRAVPVTYGNGESGWDVTPIEPSEILERAEKVLGVLPCEECGHSLSLHFDRYGCEYERGDHEGGEGDHGPYGAYAMGPAAAKRRTCPTMATKHFCCCATFARCGFCAPCRKQN